MRTLTVASDLAAPADEVWTRVTTMAGVNEEMRPWMGMRAPARWRHATIRDLPVGEPLGRAWLLLGGVLPVDYDDIMFTELGPGRVFQERSSLLSARVWEHRRTVTEVPGGCRVTDLLRFEPRIALAAPVLTRVVGWLFRHRHRRLVARFGALPR